MKLAQIKKYASTIAIATALPLFFAACGGAGTASSTDESSLTFPTSLAVASPLSYSNASTSSNLASYSSSGVLYSDYAITEEAIQLMLAASSSSCTFDASLFLTQDSNADCYGPVVAYENHPDATTGPADGDLPPGDVGIWLETDPTTGDACMAAQLNSRLQSTADNANASLMALASLICTANLNGIALPDASTPTVTITTEMNALGVTDTSFGAASLNYDATANTYSYHIELTYAPSSSYDITVDMAHTPTTGVGFSGQYSYLINDSYTGGNCPTTDVTKNGSVQYELDASGNMKTQVRTALFCEHDSDGRDSNYIVDPSKKYSSTVTDGWGNNFTIFTSNYTIPDRSGNYAFSWQAGPDDDNSRTFNLNLDTTTETAIAYFGYGDDIASTDGSITGFICNWTGPGSDHTIGENVQYQEMSVDTSSGIAVIVSDAANITYAPTVSCEYDGTGSFVFDTDVDSDLTDEDPTLDITLASGTMDLLPGTDVDGDGNATIEEFIGTTSFTLPTM